MVSPAVLIGLLCVQGFDAASILRGNAAVKAVETQGKSSKVQEQLSGFLEQAKKVQQNPQAQQAEGSSGMSYSERVIMQLIFGVLYYFLIVSHYPKLDDVAGGFPITDAKKIQEAKNKFNWVGAKKIQDLDEVSATLEVNLPNCILSFCCTGPRAAHTFHSTGIMNYWAGCVLMSCCPCITLWIVNSFTELNIRLRGEKRNFCMGAICACFCTCCVVAQDAQALDYLTGMDTGFCGVEEHAEK